MFFLCEIFLQRALADFYFNASIWLKAKSINETTREIRRVQGFISFFLLVPPSVVKVSLFKTLCYPGDTALQDGKEAVRKQVDEPIDG